MIGTITYVRRPTWLKCSRPFVLWWLRREIRAAERYVEQTRKGGVFNAHQIDQLQRNIGPLRVQLAWWQRA